MLRTAPASLDAARLKSPDSEPDSDESPVTDMTYQALTPANLLSLRDISHPPGSDDGRLTAANAPNSAAGLVDPTNVGIIGLSYGRFMAAWAVVRSNVSVTSIPTSGIMNWLSVHNTSNLGRLDESNRDGRPYHASGLYLEKSPVMSFDGRATPTLRHGDAQLTCPISQAQQSYQGLPGTRYETEPVTYRAADHGVTERSHWIAVQQRIRARFTLHLGPQR